MAFSFGAQLGTSQATGSTTTQVVTVGGGGAGVGALVVVYASKSTANATASAIDSKGNTYTAQRNGTEPVDLQGLTLLVSVLSIALVNSDTITVTFGGTFAVKQIAVLSFTANGAISFGSANSATSTFPHTAKSGGALTVVDPGELLISGWDENFAPETWTQGAGYTSQLTLNDGGGVSSMYVEYKLAAGATGSITPSATVSTGSSSIGIGARFTEAAAATASSNKLKRWSY